MEEAFPTEIYEHDVQLTKDAPNKLDERPYKMNGIRLAQLKEQLDKMEEKGIIEKGDSPYVSPVFYVLKKAGEGKTACKGRLCYDYRKLNAIIEPQNFPLANTRNFFDSTRNCKYFAVVDVRNAFLSIRLSKRAQTLCAIITPLGVYLPKRSPFGLKIPLRHFALHFQRQLEISEASFSTWMTL